MKVTPFFITTPPILPTTLFLWEEKSNPFFFSYLKNSTPLPFTREGGGGGFQIKKVMLTDWKIAATLSL